MNFGGVGSGAAILATETGSNNSAPAIYAENDSDNRRGFSGG